MIMGKKGRIVLFLFLIAIFYAINNYFMLKNELPLPIEPDEATHLISSLKHYNILTNPSIKMFKQLLEVNNHYPPLFHFSAAILNVFFGTSRTVSVMTNIIYFLIMLFSVYFIGKKIKDKNTGLFACFILSVFPMVFGMSRWFMLEFALTAMVCLSICCLLYSENFTNRRYSLLFGLSLGLGMLTKWTFVFFIIGPFLYILLSKQKKNIRNLTYAIIIGLLISLIWYSVSFESIRSMGLIERFRVANIRISAWEFPWHSLDGLLFYFRSLSFYQISPFFFILFLLSLPLFLRTKIKSKSILITWVLIPYIILTAIDNKWAHYIMPVLPALALILAISLLAAPFKILRYGLICVAIVGGSLQFFYINHFGYGKNEKFDLQNMWDYIYAPTRTDYWSELKELNKIIMGEVGPYIKEASLKREKLVVGIVDPQPSITFTIKYLVLKNKWQNIEIVGFCHEADRFLELSDRFDLLIINYSSKLWPDEYSVEEMFKVEKLDKIKGLNIRDYRMYTEVLKELYKRFKVTKVMRIAHSTNPFDYLYILTKSDKQKEYETTEWERIISASAFLKREEASLTQGPLKLLLDKGTARLFYKDIELTKAEGIYTSFNVEGQLYQSTQAAWQIEKINNRKIIARGSWPDLPLTQVWEMELIEEGGIDWKVEMEAEEKVKIKRWRSSMKLSGRYEEWISLDENKKFREYRDWNGVVLKDLANRCIGVGRYKGKKNIPEILFEAATECIPVINYSRKIRGLCFHGAEKDNIFLLGRKQFFSGKIMLMNRKKMDEYIEKSRRKAQAEKRKERASLSINRGELEVFFDRGQGRIYYQGRELTKRFGLYTSLFSDGFWQDSRNAVWEIERINDYKIIAHGEWIYLPISQDWEIELVSDNTIVWKIKMHIYEEVNIEREQTNIMLSSEYRDWVVTDTGRRGKFPVRFNQGWKVLYLGDAKTTKIAVNRSKKGKEYLPSVLFDCSSMPENYSISAKNTDELFNSRVLSCRKVNKGRMTKLLPGEYEYFIGKIEIDTLH